MLHPFAHHCQHARNNSQHCCANNVGSCCVRLRMFTLDRGFIKRFGYKTHSVKLGGFSNGTTGMATRTTSKTEALKKWNKFSMCSTVSGPGGDSHMKGSRMLVGNFELNPFRGPIWPWPNLVLTPKSDHFKLWLHQSSKQNELKIFNFLNISSRATLEETFTG